MAEHFSKVWKKKVFSKISLGSAQLLRPLERKKQEKQIVTESQRTL